MKTKKTVKTAKKDKSKPRVKAEPLSQDQIKANMFFLENLKRLAFNNDHPGIDKMVSEMKKQVEEPEEPEA